VAIEANYSPQNSPIILITYESGPRGAFAEITLRDLEGVNRLREVLIKSGMVFNEASPEDLANNNGITVEEVANQNLIPFFTIRNPDMAALSRDLRKDEMIGDGIMHEMQREFIRSR